MKEVRGLCLGAGMLGMMAVLVLSLGCAKSGRESSQKPGAELAGQSGEKLDYASIIQFRLVPEGAYPGQPELKVDAVVLSPEEEVFRQRNQVVFKNTIYLKEVPLFLVWSEPSVQGNARIRDAWVVHRSRDPQNRMKEGFQRVSARFDSAGKRWFLPLREALGGDSLRGDPNEQHELELSLLDEGGELSQVFLTLRAFLPLPSSGVLLKSSNLEPEVQSSEFAVAEDVLANPTARGLVAWVRAIPSRVFEQRTMLSVPRFVLHPLRAPQGPFIENFVSVARFQVSRLELSGRGEREQDISPALHEGQWVGISLPPGARLSLRWIAQSMEPSCGGLPGSVRSVNWSESVAVPCRGRECNQVDRMVPRISEVDERWTVAGVSIYGSYGREIRLADGYLSREEATSEDAAEGRVLQLFGGDARVYFERGQHLGNEVSRSVCQGTGWK